MSKNIVICVDSETGSVDPHTAQLCSIGAVAVDTQKLEIVSGSDFYSLLKPEDPSKIEQGALDVNKLTMEELMKAPSEKTVWNNFIDYTKKYKSGNTHWGLPPFCTYNGISFDLIIFDRMAKKYGNVDKDGRQNVWHRRDQIDLIHHTYAWLGYTGQVNSISFDNVRTFLGMKAESQAHHALSDAKDTAKLFIRFFRLYKELATRIPFKDAFSE